MRVGGYGELENIRKLMQKEEGKHRSTPSPVTSSYAAATNSDAVEISEQAKMLGKLRQIPDLRQEKIEEVLEELNHGTLMTPEAVKESVARLLEGILL